MGLTEYPFDHDRFDDYRLSIGYSLVAKRCYHRASSVACEVLDVIYLVAKWCHHPHKADGMRCGWHAMRWYAMRWYAMRWYAMRWYAMRWYAMRWYAWRAGLRGVGREWRWAGELDDVRSGWLMIVACHLACRGGSRIWQPDLKSFANLLSTWLAQVEANLDASKTTTIASRLHRQACDQWLLAAPT